MLHVLVIVWRRCGTAAWTCRVYLKVEEWEAFDMFGCHVVRHPVVGVQDWARSNYYSTAAFSLIHWYLPVGDSRLSPASLVRSRWIPFVSAFLPWEIGTMHTIYEGTQNHFCKFFFLNLSLIMSIALINKFLERQQPSTRTSSAGLEHA